jgi:adenylate kinase
MDLLLIGAQGSGKGTQAMALSAALGVPTLSSGDMFRLAVSQGTPLGLQAREYMDRGELVPDTITIGLMLDLLSGPDYEKGVILDGFPRNRDQAKALDAELARHGRAIDRVVYLNVPRAVLLDRIEGRYVCEAAGHVYNLRTKPPRQPGICDIDGSRLYQRSDDTPESIERRLNIFFNQTIQVVHYYRAQRKLIEIDGNQPIEMVTAEMLRALGFPSELSA